MSPVQLTSVDWQTLWPLLTLFAAGLLVLVWDLLLPTKTARPLWFLTSLAGLAVAAWQLLATPTGLSGFGGAIVLDEFSRLVGLIFPLSALYAVLLSSHRQEADLSGYLALILWATAGMSVLAGAGNLMTLFLGLEILSLGLYVVVAFGTGREAPVSREAAFKYLILGSVASAFLIFGFALLYGGAGSVVITEIGEALAGGATPLLLGGFALALVGLAFKLALVPFHVWAPDVYSGAPVPVTAFMIVGTKAAAFAALARLLFGLVPTATVSSYMLPVVILAGFSMLWGNLAAIPQTDIKRLMAYSGIAHAGYLFAGLPSLSNTGLSAATFYLFAYAFMTLGVFAVAVYLDQRGEEGFQIPAYKGLFYRHPWLAAAMTLYLLSLAGLPPTAGFSGKVYLLGAALSGGGLALALILILGSAVSFYVYLRIVLLMFQPVRETAAEAAGESEAVSGQVAAAHDRPAVSVSLATAVLVTVWGTLQFGLLPGGLLDAARLVALWP